MQAFTDIETSTIPIIDLAELKSNRESIVQTLGNGLKEYGFVAVKNHGVDPRWFKYNYQSLEKVFSLDNQIKQKYNHPEIGNQRGYMPLHTGETHPNSDEIDYKECWQIGALDEQNIYPEEVDGFKFNNFALFCEMQDLGITVLELLDDYLEAQGRLKNLSLQYLNDNEGVHIGAHLQRSIHYPPMKNPKFNEEGLVIRGASHNDLNLITLLPTSTNEGLQILRRNGEWLSVNVPPDVIIINAADMLMLMTDGEIPSTPHRVVATKDNVYQQRFSIPFFFHPCHSYPLINLKTGNTITLPNGLTLDRADKYVWWRLTNILPEGTVPSYEIWEEGNRSFTPKPLQI